LNAAPKNPATKSPEPTEGFKVTDNSKDRRSHELPKHPHYYLAKQKEASAETVVQMQQARFESAFVVKIS
jgi:hypothetical protein